MRIFASAAGELTLLQISSLTVIGGASGTGLRLGRLKNREDYAILSLEKDRLAVHPLVGGEKATVTVLFSVLASL